MGGCTGGYGDGCAAAGERALTLSLTAIVWLPEVLSVMLKVDWPPGSAALAGSTAVESLLEKLTVPEYVVALLL